MKSAAHAIEDAEVVDPDAFEEEVAVEAIIAEALEVVTTDDAEVDVDGGIRS